MNRQTTKNFHGLKKIMTAFAILLIGSAFAAEKAAAPAAVNPNLMTNGDFHDTKAWRTAFYVSPGKGVDRNAVTAEMKKLSVKTFVKGENGHMYAKISTPATVKHAELSGFSTEFNLKEALKADHEGCFTFRYRGTSAAPGSGAFYAVVKYRNGHEHYGNWGHYNMSMKKEWVKKEIRFKVPAGTLTIDVNMGLTGTGSCEFGDITLTLTPIAAKK